MSHMVALDLWDEGEGVCYRLIRSVSCLRQLKHENLLPLQMVNLDARSNLLTLFYVDADTSLEVLLRRGLKLPFYQVKDILQQVLRALAYCHGRGICHRNLKPKNIMLRMSSRGSQAKPLFDVRAAHLGGDPRTWLSVEP